MQNAKCKNPYEELYIYYLQGRLNAERIAWENFIGNWEEEGFSFLFFSKPAENEVNALLSAHPELILTDQFCMSYEEWQGTRLSSFRAGSFVIYPPWEIPEIQGHEIPIISDPGVVFGTGTHPTTRDCLYFIEQVCKDQPIEFALDLGCGTGLLALAAAKAGCGKVIAADFNFLAAKTTGNNIVLNGLENQVIAVQADAKEIIAYPAELVIANIHYAVMKELISVRAFFEKEFFILSGLLRSEAKDIAVKLAQGKARIIETREHEGVWHTFFGTTT